MNEENLIYLVVWNSFNDCCFLGKFSLPSEQRKMMLTSYDNYAKIKFKKYDALVFPQYFFLKSKKDSLKIMNDKVNKYMISFKKDFKWLNDYTKKMLSSTPFLFKIYQNEQIPYFIITLRRRLLEYLKIENTDIELYGIGKDYFKKSLIN